MQNVAKRLYNEQKTLIEVPLQKRVCSVDALLNVSIISPAPIPALLSLTSGAKCYVASVEVAALHSSAERVYKKWKMCLTGQHKLMR